MQRWFFLEDRKKPKIKKPETKMSVKVTKQQEILCQLWTFTVSVPNVGPKDKLYITGSTYELGSWDPISSLLMEQDVGTDMWSKTVTIPNTCKVYYRYAICATLEDSSQIIVKQWETNVKPRVITENMRHPGIDTFGEYDGEQRVDKGWLTVQTLLQFKFMKNPLKLKSPKGRRPMNIKITPVTLTFGNDLHALEDSSQSLDTIETPETPQGVMVEVCTLDNDPKICYPKPQEQFGREYKTDDILLINILAPNYQNLAYLVDFYSYSSHAGFEDPPCHVGYTYILPNILKSSYGSLELPVTCNVKHRPLGTINIEYLVINPMTPQCCDFKVSYSKHWNKSWTGLDVGHRGLGASFKTKGHTIRENTLASLKKAAASGADMLEFDVQLSKDMIPVIYHDFYVCISMKRKKEIDMSEMLELPVKDLTLEHLQKLKVYHLVEGRSREALFNDEDLDEHQPFPTLELILNAIDSNVGFNVELKWNMELDDGTFELNNPFDMNEYVDKVLQIILQNAGHRRIVFSCFNPDICTMVRNKQNKYPVMFLTQGVTNKYQSYRDPRCASIPAAIQNAISSDILGIVVHTEDLLRDPTQVKLVTDAGLVIFCWGDENNDRNTIKKLKEMGLHAVIYDKLDQITTKGAKESIFLVEARDSQKELMLAALEEGSSAAESSVSVGSAEPREPPAPPAPPAPRAILDLRVRDQLKAGASTATSLESLASDDSGDSRKRRQLIQVQKELQVKEQTNTFSGLFPKLPTKEDATKSTPKKCRND